MQTLSVIPDLNINNALNCSFNSVKHSDMFDCLHGSNGFKFAILLLILMYMFFLLMKPT